MSLFAHYLADHLDDLFISTTHLPFKNCVLWEQHFIVQQGIQKSCLTFELEISRQKTKTIAHVTYNRLIIILKWISTHFIIKLTYYLTIMSISCCMVNRWTVHRVQLIHITAMSDKYLNIWEKKVVKYF